VDGDARAWWWPEGEEDRARARCLGMAARRGRKGEGAGLIFVLSASKP